MVHFSSGSCATAEPTYCRCSFVYSSHVEYSIEYDYWLGKELDHAHYYNIAQNSKFYFVQAHVLLYYIAELCSRFP